MDDYQSLSHTRWDCSTTLSLSRSAEERCSMENFEGTSGRYLERLRSRGNAELRKGT